jgi:glycine/D-amino acid oxidase-like deaminating enzyme
MTFTAEVVICGAGIAGIATAYQLAVTQGVPNVVLVDERPPLSLTSDKSSEAYRNWWPDDVMVRLMNRSIDWLERWAAESHNRFLLNRRGYLYLTANPDSLPDFQRAAQQAALAGAGEVRVQADRSTTSYVPIDPHGFAHQPSGSDLLLDRALILERFPGVNPDVVAAIHARRCGWFSGQQLGMYLLEQARAHGVTLINDRIDRISVKANRVEAVHLASDRSISTRSFVNAAGPLTQAIGEMLGVAIPVAHELHLKIVLKDHLRIVPRAAPLMIWTDPQHLPWTDDERADLASSAETRWLLDELPGGVHLRPEGGLDNNLVLMLWAYHAAPREPIVPPPLDEFFPEVVLRGLAAMFPGLRTYFGRAPALLYDGGYYTKTPENRPLAGPLPVEGTYICGALSGYGLMASAAVSELVAAHITGSALPEYAAAFTFDRYHDPAYRRWLAEWQPTGQL